MNWLDKLAGKIGRWNGPPAHGEDTPQQRPDRKGGDTVLRERIAVASPPNDPEAVHAAEAQVAAEWKVGDVILDLYEVKHIHEGGGMGLVYRVHHRGWNIDLAVKSPRHVYFQAEAHKENFARECETWINLGLHPHIVSCYYVRTLGSVPRVFAEFVEGGSLKEWIDSRRLYEGGPQAAIQRILDIAIQAAWGLHYAHEQGVIHQDVKPANVLMTPDGTAKIADFGLSKARALAGESVMGGTGRSILVSSGGMTPAYCSPEQASFEPLSRKADIWSWAVSVLEMLVGEVCWQSGIAAPEVLKHLDGLRVAGVGIPEPPPHLLRLLEHCFAVEPGGRPENCLAVADRLKSIYLTLAGDHYFREFPEAAKLQSDALNNRAVSMLDLGRPVEAQKLFDRALKMDPGHPQATYNLGLYLWRNARGTDYAIVKALEQSQTNRLDDWNVPYLLGWIHLERRDAEGAVAAFSAAEKLKGSAEVQQALAEARRIETSALKCLRTFEGHTESVTSVALSADGRWALAGSRDKTLRLWEVNSGKCLRTFEGHAEGVTSVALSGDGRWALSASWDKTLRFWDLSSGKCLNSFAGHTDPVESVALSTDGHLALLGSWDRALHLWDVSTWKCLRTFEGHQEYVNSVVLSADGRWALSGSGPYASSNGDSTVRLWDLSNGKCLRIFEGHKDSVVSVALSADGRWALSGSRDKTARLWEVSSGKCVRTFEGDADVVWSVALSADGCWALSGRNDNTVRLWEVSSGKCVRTFEGHTKAVRSVALSADGRWALSGSTDKTVRLLRLTGLQDGIQAPSAPLVVCRLASATEHVVVERHFHALLSAAVHASSEGKYARAWTLAVQSKALPGHRFSAEASDVAHRAGLHGKRTGLRGGWCQQMIKNGQRFSSGSMVLSADGSWSMLGRGEAVELREVSSGRCLRTFEGHTKWVGSVALSADERLALSGSGDNTFRLWEVSSGRCLRTFEGHTEWMKSVALSPDGSLALSSSGDKTLRLWEVNSGKCLRTFEGPTEAVETVVLSADSRWALSGSGRDYKIGDNNLRLWEVRNGKCLRTFEGHTDLITSVALSVDMSLAVSGSRDNTLRVWDVSAGTCLRTFEWDASWVTSVALSPDGRWALSGSRDKTVRLWDIINGKCLRTFEEHTFPVNSVAWSADGRWALSLSMALSLSERQDTTLLLWELEWDYEFPEQKDWDEGARPHLVNFLTLHTPYVSTDPDHPDFLLRRGRPSWDHNDWLRLLRTLQNAGYGWLNPEGVHRELERIKAQWQGPPPMPWEQVT